jgi:hypothetical protein
MPLANIIVSSSRVVENVTSHLSEDRRGIAQSGSAPALGAGCRGFESLYPDHLALVAQPDRASAF